jgi:primosomal replication protein N
MPVVVEGFIGRPTVTPAGVVHVFHIPLEGPGVKNSGAFPRTACLNTPTEMTGDDHKMLAEQLRELSNAFDRKALEMMSRV